MKKDLISIIIPIYNVDKFLSYSIESAISQTYSNLEIILVNDGSTDKSKLICEMYQKKDKRIKLINQDNKGISAARNAGIEIATGEYIGFIDADDIVSKEFYECLYKLIKETNSDVSECASVQISEEDLFNHEYKFDNIDNLSYITVDSLGALHRINNEEVYIVGKSIVVWNKLYKRELWNEIRFPEGKRYEDDLTTYKIFNKIKKLVSTEIVLYNYVQRKNSAMHQEFSLKRLEALEVFDNYINFFKEYKDDYLFAKCLVRYLRVLGVILEELCKSEYQNKKSVMTILENKFKEVNFMIESNMNYLNSNEYEYVTKNKKVYNERFKKILENNNIVN